MNTFKSFDIHLKFNYNSISFESSIKLNNLNSSSNFSIIKNEFKKYSFSLERIIQFNILSSSSSSSSLRILNNENIFIDGSKSLPYIIHPIFPIVITKD